MIDGARHIQSVRVSADNKSDQGLHEPIATSKSRMCCYSSPQTSILNLANLRMERGSLPKKAFSGLIVFLISIGISTLVYASGYANIDVYTQYPAPRGGQGPDQPSDGFTPGDTVILYTLTTWYNWPEQNKWVVFEITDSQDNKFLLYGMTDVNGIATTSIQIPQPNPNVFGTWPVQTRVSVAEEQCEDSLTFEVQRPVNRTPEGPIAAAMMIAVIDYLATRIYLHKL